MTLAARLRSALERDRAMGPILLTGDFHDDMLGPGETFVPAAVLVAVTDRADPGVLLTTRSETMRKHAGQIAFPGGRMDPEDDSLVATALREAEEEIGLTRQAVEIVGVGDVYRTVTGYAVTPVVGVVAPDLPLVPHDAEVADWFEVPLSHLLEPANHIEHAVEWEGRARHVYEIGWQGRRIWGATAAMIVNLAHRLATPA